MDGCGAVILPGTVQRYRMPIMANRNDREMTHRADSRCAGDQQGPAIRRRGRFDATVQFNRTICREHFLLRLRVHGAFPATAPGQFVQLGCRPPDTQINDDWAVGKEHVWDTNRPVKLVQPELCGSLGLLRRPFSIAGRGDDDQGVWIDVIHRVIGVGTAWLADLAPGDPLDLIGPLGNAFTLPSDKSTGLLVGGGVGLPPMFYLAQMMQQAQWRAVGFAGAVTRDLLAVTFVQGIEPDPGGRPTPSVREFARYGIDAVVTTDDGSVGLPGRITAGLECVLRAMPDSEASKTVIYTCGPEPMMYAVAKLASSRGIDCQACLEQAMACGMGTCQSCVVRIEDDQDPQEISRCRRPWRYRLTCTDGPVFPASSVIWDTDDPVHSSKPVDRA